MKYQQLQFFTRPEMAAMRDPTKARNYSPGAAEFRRDHAERRRWGLIRRHAEKLCRLHGCAGECVALGLHDHVESMPWAALVDDAISARRSRSAGPRRAVSAGPRRAVSVAGPGPRLAHPSAAGGSETAELADTVTRAEPARRAEATAQAEPTCRPGAASQTPPRRPADVVSRADTASRDGNSRRADTTSAPDPCHAEQANLTARAGSSLPAELSRPAAGNQ